MDNQTNDDFMKNSYDQLKSLHKIIQSNNLINNTVKV